MIRSRNTGLLRRKGLLSFVLSIVMVCSWAPIFGLRADEPTESTNGNSKGVAQQEVVLPSLEEVQCASYYCYDRTTGEVLISKNEDKKIYPASMTKILTLALCMEYLEPTDMITVSKTAMDATTPNSTMMGLTTGEELPANELYFGMMLPSGNDAANVLAEAIATKRAQTNPLPTPTPDPANPNAEVTQISLIGQFAKIANEKLAELGLTNSHFVNPNGLHNENHYTTAKELCMMFDYAWGFDDFRTVVSAPTHTFKADNKHGFDGWKTVRNTNFLLTDPWILGSDSHCARVYGGKTGTTKQAGTGMTVLTVNENGHEIITCVCGIPYDVSDHQTVFVAAVVKAANQKCFENDPVHRVEGNVMDNRSYNAPPALGPEGSSTAPVAPTNQDVNSSTSDISGETVAPSEVTLPSESKSVITPIPDVKDETLFDSHPILVIVLIVLAVLVLIFVIITIASVSAARRRRRKMGIRKIRF